MSKRPFFQLVHHFFALYWGRFKLHPVASRCVPRQGAPFVPTPVVVLCVMRCVLCVVRCVFCWVGLGWVGLGWVGLGWVGLGWGGVGLRLGWVWVGLGCGSANRHWSPGGALGASCCNMCVQTPILWFFMCSTKRHGAVGFWGPKKGCKMGCKNPPVLFSPRVSPRVPPESQAPSWEGTWQCHRQMQPQHVQKCSGDVKFDHVCSFFWGASATQDQKGASGRGFFFWSPKILLRPSTKRDPVNAACFCETSAERMLHVISSQFVDRCWEFL